MFKKVYSTKINVVANYSGSIWTALLNILFVPIYLRYIGIEAYGLVGIFVSIQTLISLLDFGLSPSVNRELARLSTQEDKAQEMHDLRRTLEIPNWCLALFIAVFLCLLSPVISNYWIQPKDLTQTTVTQALLIISFNIAIQFSTNFYVGALMGLRKQLLLNLITIFCGTLRNVGAFFVLAYYSPTIQAFLIWQGSIYFVQILLLALTLNRSLPSAAEKGKFRLDLLKKIWRFAAGMTGISVVSLILTQMDKVILSKMLSLDNFGYYTLAVVISATAISTAVGAIAHAVYPEFSRLVSLGDEKVLSDFYHKSCQIVSVILIPTVMVLAVFSYDILHIWTHNPLIAENTGLILTLLAIGSGLNCLMWMPYYLMLAYGWTKLSFYVNVVAIIILIPAMIYAIYKFGAAGAAGTWVILNGSYVLFTIQIMHRRILKGEQWRWYFKDIAPTLIINIIIVMISYGLYPAEKSFLTTFLWLAVTGLLGLTVPVLINPNTRGMLKTVGFLRNT